MGEVGRRACEENGVSWLDLSGNAHIVSGGLRIHIEGRSNRFLSAGRPLNLFAPKSSRVVRWLLINPDKPFTQHEIARATKMDEGLVSRVVKRLLAEGLVVRDSNYAVKPRDPSLLLKSWLERYQFWRHTVYQGHAAARSGDALLNFVSDTLTAEGIGHAATGLAAAWVFTRFAAFRVVTIYLENEPSPDLKERLDFREESRGSNLWLVVPNDEGVFHGAMEKDGIRCAHPVQVCLDLKEHPERSAEAADKLRGELFRRGLSGKIPAASAIGDPALRISEKLGRPLRVIDMGKNK
ncbi:MAG: MarR family transcriptional regulator [Proteobacteria bacterium]|nr:MarR family transcriptional regulator [Pseudomonadota bacterium]